MSRKQRPSGNTQPTTTFRPIQPKNDEQRLAIEEIKNNDIIWLEGIAGTGKTFLAAAVGAQLLHEGKFKKIVITRATVGTESLGYLPGDQMSKVLPFMAPVLTELGYFLNVDNEIKAGRISIEPTAYVRGVTWIDSYVLIDEMFNLSANQLKTIVTRIGKGSKLVFTGHHTQSDLSEANCKVIEKMLNSLDQVVTPEDKIAFVTLYESVRHPIIKKILGVWGE